MSARLSCPPAPGSLEAFAVQFDSLFQTLAQRRGFRCVSVRTAAAARPVKDAHGAGRRRAAGPGPSGRSAAAAVFPVRVDLWDADRVTEHVARQRLASVGKIDNGIVAVTQAVGE